MQTIQASEAKTHFLRILDDVERGESVIVSRHGKEVAVISPKIEMDREKVKRAFANIRALRELNQPVTVEEILSARNEGRR
jgi:prevent-host-death family protein